MQRILLVRHAESANNDAHARLIADLGHRHPDLRERSEAARVSDPALTGRGEEQSRRLARALAERTEGERVLLVASPMRRALLTAQAVALELRLERERCWCYGDLYEVGGCYVGEAAEPGATPEEIEAEFSVVCREVPAEGWFSGRRLPEHPVEAGERVERLVRWIEQTATAERERFDTAIVVAHGDLMTRWLRRWLGVPWRRPLAFVHGNTGITELRWRPEEGVLVLGQNDLAHLPDHLRSGSRVPEVWWSYATPELAVDRFEGDAEVDPELWRAAVELRRRLLLAREGRSIEEYLESDGRSIHFVARVRGEVAGVAQYDPSNGRLRQLAVDPDFRGGRVGRALVEAVRDEARRHGRDELLVHAWEESAEFYQRVGFRLRGEVVDDRVPWRPLSLDTGLAADGEA